ncbi:hypothetical protein GGI05_006288 [Coemansia sp. RSA 2603]|nr:hypothetical protein GGI05_006288 [Coemansia sp. RSA 2603]
MVVGVAGHRGVGLLDAREMSRGAFRQMPWPQGHSAQPVGLRWVPPLGDLLMVMLSDGRAHLWDTRDGGLRSTLVGVGDTPGGQHMAVTPDGSVVLGGYGDGSVAYWEVERALEKQAEVRAHGVLGGSHAGAVSVCAFNPALMECVTAATSLAFWSV